MFRDRFSHFSDHSKIVTSSFLVIGLAATVILVSSKNQFGFNTRAATETLSVPTSSGDATLSYSGPVGTLKKQTPENGVIILESPLFACVPLSANCEPDRYELSLNSDIAPLYGLGRQHIARQANIKLHPQSDGSYQFLDTLFSSGHIFTNQDTKVLANQFMADPGRMRTPVVISPKANLLVAYIQPEIKMVRFTVSGNSTNIVFKKSHLLPEGSPGKLVVINGNSLTDVYQKYYRTLKLLGFYFKQPHWNAYGLNWETVGEFSTQSPIAGGATVAGLREVVKRYESEGLQLSGLTFGSGYWKPDSATLCSEGGSDYSGIYRLPTIDSLLIKEPELRDFFKELNQKNIYPSLGMRQHASTNPSSTIGNKTGVERLSEAFGPTTSPIFYLNDFLFHRYSTNSFYPVKLLRLDNPNITKKFDDLLQQAYGPFKGIKEDEMLYGYQQFMDPKLSNLKDGTVSKALQAYVENRNGDFVSASSNDWFGVATDTQVYGTLNAPPPSQTTYILKDALDISLNMVFSGYPHPWLQFDTFADNLVNTNPQSNFNCNNACSNSVSDAQKLSQYNQICKIQPSRTKQLIRNLAASVFSPYTIESRGFWHISNPNEQKSYIFFSRLRERLHQYTYDMALEWYADGTSHLMRPLLFDWQSDPEVQKMYTSNDPNQPKNQYLFGDALLVRPVFSDQVSNLPVYFPAGKWRSFLQSNQPLVNGGKYSNYTMSNSNLSDYPVFLREGKLLPIIDYQNSTILNVYFFLEPGRNTTDIYNLHAKSGQVFARLQGIRKPDGAFVVKNLNTNQEVPTVADNFKKGFRVANITSFISTNNDMFPYLTSQYQQVVANFK